MEKKRYAITILQWSCWACEKIVAWKHFMKNKIFQHWNHLIFLRPLKRCSKEICDITAREAKWQDCIWKNNLKQYQILQFYTFLWQPSSNSYESYFQIMTLENFECSHRLSNKFEMGEKWSKHFNFIMSKFIENISGQCLSKNSRFTWVWE